MKQFGKQVCAALAALVMCVTPAAQAAAQDGVAQLKRFVRDTARAEGQFAQAVYRQNGGRADESEGSFSFERPGKFRWNYTKPYPQVLVGDGTRLWSYDPELAQVTVKKMGDAAQEKIDKFCGGPCAFDKICVFCLPKGFTRRRSSGPEEGQSVRPFRHAWQFK